MTDIVAQARQLLDEHTCCEIHDHASPTAHALADAGLLTQPARTGPTREELTTTIMRADRDPRSDYTPQADAVQALLVGQPTVAEVEAQAHKQVTTVEELEALPTGTVIRATGTQRYGPRVAERAGTAWIFTGGGHETSTNLMGDLPATILYSPNLEAPATVTQ